MSLIVYKTLCQFAPVMYVFAYIAGKWDLWSLEIHVEMHVKAKCEVTDSELSSCDGITQ